MKQKYVLFLITLNFTIYFTACTSSSYKYDKVQKSDTMSVKDTVGVDKMVIQKLMNTKKVYMVKSAPTFVLSLAGQLNIGNSELSLNDNPGQFIEGQNFGVQNGWGLSAAGKIPVNQLMGNFRILFQGVFNHFNNSFTQSTATDFGSVQYNIFSAGVGVENTFNPKFTVKPFIGAAILGSLVSGKSSYTSSGVANEITIKNSFRLGFTLYAGIEYAVSDRIGINLGARFTNINTWLKKSKMDSDPNNISLRDAFSSPHIPYGGWKNFAFTSLSIGTSIYFGVENLIFKF
jgi:opacity protein-like surface antigen